MRGALEGYFFALDLVVRMRVREWVRLVRSWSGGLVGVCQVVFIGLVGDWQRLPLF